MTDHEPSWLFISFEGTDAKARLELDWGRVPDVCRAVVDAAPFTALAHHGIYSGSEIAAITPFLPELSLDAGTSVVHVGEVAYTFLRAEEHHGVEEDFAEIAWFYDSDVRPSMFNGPAAMVVFGRLTDADAFFRVSRDMRLEGAKQIRVER